jgi:hypothetical protein
MVTARDSGVKTDGGKAAKFASEVLQILVDVSD